MSGHRFVRWGDGVLILLLLLASFGITLATLSQPRGTHAIITVDGKRVGLLPVGVPVSFDAEGPLGTTRVEGDAKGIHIIASPCPNKICIHMGYVRMSGQTLICVPNHVAVRIEGAADEGVDGVTG